MSARAWATAPHAALLLLLCAAPSAAQEPKLPTVLARAGDYVDRFERSLSSIVAEERYSQRWSSLPREASASRRRSGSAMPVLKK